MEKVALILAGGCGERLWPISCKKLPKQFLCLMDPNKTMLQLTVERLITTVNPKNIFISTLTEYKEIITQQVTNIPAENIIYESASKNTAPSIYFSVKYIQNKYSNATILITPADHFIKEQILYQGAIWSAYNLAEKYDIWVTLGIKPTYAETNFGYLHFSSQLKETAFYVDHFKEKPDKELAEKYFKSGEYLWNTGQFICKISILIEAFKQYLPQIYTAKTLETCENISIDNGIIEKIKNIYVIPSLFQWNDVGSWQTFDKLLNKDFNNNAIKGNVVLLNTTNSIIQSNNKLVAAIGVENYIIINTDTTIFICNKNNINEIKTLLNLIE